MAVDQNRVPERNVGTDITRKRIAAARANSNTKNESKNNENQNNQKEEVTAKVATKEENVSTPEIHKEETKVASSNNANETSSKTTSEPVKEEKPKKRNKRTIPNNKDNKKESVLENVDKEKLKKTKQLGVSVTPTLYKAIQELLHGQQKSVSSLGYDLLKDYMKKELSSIEKKVAFQQELNDGTIITTITPEELDLLKAELLFEEE